MDHELLIKTSFSYKLNFDSIDSNWQSGLFTEVIAVTKQHCTIKKTGSLDDLLLSVVDETMKQVFAEAGANAIYGFLGNNSHIKREEIAGKPEVFSAGLERLLGSGATMLQKLILKNLYFKLGLKFEENEAYGFSDYVEDLRRRFEG